MASVLGISGASGSGKSTVAGAIRSCVAHDVLILSQDDYYCDHSRLTPSQRAALNYDEPRAIDFDLLRDHTRTLKDNRPIDAPRYDFSSHRRRAQRERLGPADLVILEGHLIFTDKELVDLIDHKLFVDTPLDLCLIRRLRRDLYGRGRSLDSILQQYTNTVRPMFFQHVQPCRLYADTVIDGSGETELDVRSLCESLDLPVRGEDSC